MKKLICFVTSLIAVLLMSACSGDVEETPAKTTQKDAYTTLDECLQDWGDKEMCTQAANAQAEVLKAQAEASAAQSQQAGNGVAMVPVVVPMFYGPEYDSDKRVAYRSNGTVIQPKSNHAFKTTPKLKPSTSFFSRRSSISKPKQVSKRSFFSRDSSRSYTRSYTRQYRRK